MATKPPTSYGNSRDIDWSSRIFRTASPRNLSISGHCRASTEATATRPAAQEGFWFCLARVYGVFLYGFYSILSFNLIWYDIKLYYFIYVYICIIIVYVIMFHILVWCCWWVLITIYSKQLGFSKLEACSSQRMWHIQPYSNTCSKCFWVARCVKKNYSYTYQKLYRPGIWKLNCSHLVDAKSLWSSLHIPWKRHKTRLPTFSGPPMAACFFLKCGFCPEEWCNCHPLSTLGFPYMGVPNNGWFMMENPLKLEDLEGPLF